MERDSPRIEEVGATGRKHTVKDILANSDHFQAHMQEIDQELDNLPPHEGRSISLR